MSCFLLISLFFPLKFTRFCPFFLYSSNPPGQVPTFRWFFDLLSSRGLIIHGMIRGVSGIWAMGLWILFSLKENPSSRRTRSNLRRKRSGRRRSGLRCRRRGRSRRGNPRIRGTHAALGWRGRRRSRSSPMQRLESSVRSKRFVEMTPFELGFFCLLMWFDIWVSIWRNGFVGICHFLWSCMLHQFQKWDIAFWIFFSSNTSLIWNTSLLKTASLCRDWLIL